MAEQIQDEAAAAHNCTYVLICIGASVLNPKFVISC
jgi:hypothetical protein